MSEEEEEEDDSGSDGEGLTSEEEDSGSDGEELMSEEEEEVQPRRAPLCLLLLFRPCLLFLTVTAPCCPSLRLHCHRLLQGAADDQAQARCCRGLPLGPGAPRRLWLWTGVHAAGCCWAMHLVGGAGARLGTDPASRPAAAPAPLQWATIGYSGAVADKLAALAQEDPEMYQKVLAALLVNAVAEAEAAAQRGETWQQQTLAAFQGQLTVINSVLPEDQRIPNELVRPAAAGRPAAGANCSLGRVVRPLISLLHLGAPAGRQPARRGDCGHPRRVLQGLCALRPGHLRRHSVWRAQGRGGQRCAAGGRRRRWRCGAAGQGRRGWCGSLAAFACVS